MDKLIKDVFSVRTTNYLRGYKYVRDIDITRLNGGKKTKKEILDYIIKVNLVKYGFADWQVQELMEKKQLDSSNGLYKIIDYNLYLVKSWDNKSIYRINLLEVN